MIELVQRSTIHGVNHIYSATNRILKILWISLFICGIIGITINIVIITKRYFTYPVIISYTLDSETFIWPDLTFCNPTAPYHFKQNSAALNHWKKVFNQSKDIVEMLAKESKLFHLIHEGNQTDIELEERTITMASADPQKLDTDWYGNEFLNVAYTQTHSGIFFTKEYQGSRPTFITSNVSQMFSTQSVQIGNNIPCHTFHIENSHDVKLSSIQSLIFSFKFDFESYKIFNSSYVYRSLFLYVTNNNELPNGKEIILTPGFSNKIKLEQSRYQNNGIRRNCRYEKYKIELYDALLLKTQEYEGDYEDCKEIVSQQLYVVNCNCYNPFLPVYKIEGIVPRLCLNATYFTKAGILQNANCMVQVYESYHNQDSFNKVFNKHCSMYKPMKCDSLSYKVFERKEMFVELWSNSTNDRRYGFMKTLYQSLHSGETVGFNFINIIRDSYIKLTVERQYESGDLYKEQREYPFSELLSDIGGLMGLWLGMSVVGLFEVVEYFYLCCKGIHHIRQPAHMVTNEVINGSNLLKMPGTNDILENAC